MYSSDLEIEIDEDSLVYRVGIGTSTTRRPDVTASTSSFASKEKPSG